MKLVGGKLCSLALDESVCTGMIDHFLVSNFKWYLDVLCNDFDAKACIACIFYSFLAGAWIHSWSWRNEWSTFLCIMFRRKVRSLGGFVWLGSRFSWYSSKTAICATNSTNGKYDKTWSDWGCKLLFFVFYILNCHIRSFQENSPTTKVLHLSDVHLDLSYQIGTTTDCGLPMCCMNSTEMADDASKAAGYWGAYYCDSPVWMFENMLSQIQEQFGDVSNLKL